MKITPKQYAKAFLASLDGQDAAAVKRIAAEFVRLLVANNDLVLAEKIISFFSQFWDQKEGVVEANVFSVHKLNRRSVELIKRYVERVGSAKKVVLQEVIDKELVGGIIVRFGDSVWDLSLKKQLSQLQKEMAR